MESKKRLFELDAIRGIAAFAVLLYHYTTRYGELFGHVKTPYFDFSYGYLGVHIFFIISGYVILITLEKTKDIKSFVTNRAERLYPAYIVSVVLTFSIVSVFGLAGREVTINNAILNLTMVQGLTMHRIPYVDGAYWSLTVQILFYVIMGGLLFKGMLKKIDGLLITWLLFSILIEVISVFFSNKIFGLGYIQFYGMTEYSYLFIAGIAFYKLKTDPKSFYYVLIIFCLVYPYLFIDLIIGVAVTFFFFLFYLMIRGKLSFLNNRVLNFFGTISYALYLIHQNVGYVILNQLYERGLTSDFLILIPILISIGLAWIITSQIEKPFLRFIKEQRKRKVKVVLNESKVI